MTRHLFTRPRTLRSALFPAALLLSAACLVVSTPGRADPHDHGHGRNEQRIRERHQEQHSHRGIEMRARHADRHPARARHRDHDARRYRDSRDRQRELRRKRALRERQERMNRQRYAWHQHREEDRHHWLDHDRWWGWNGWGDHHRRDPDARFFLGFHGPGVWVHGWDDGRFGWWLSVAGSWYFYPEHAPPGQVIVLQTAPTPAESGPAAPPPPRYWYYCRGAGEYYPYVHQCPGGWQKVPARPSGQ
ncbi:MAG TPA: hypothetical protein VFA86_14085 [Gammaproteobacteria bacterium]|nr:hypothetical protein [Gammaproteobacteria bacterium]